MTRAWTLRCRENVRYRSSLSGDKDSRSERPYRRLMRGLALLVRLQLRLRRRYCKFGARPKIIGDIVGLGRSLGMKIVAEGAETPEEIAILREFRCDMVQGYAYARPAEAQEALAIA